MWGICGKTLDKMGLDPHILARGLDPPISAKTLDHPILAKGWTAHPSQGLDHRFYPSTVLLRPILARGWTTHFINKKGWTTPLYWLGWGDLTPPPSFSRGCTWWLVQYCSIPLKQIEVGRGVISTRILTHSKISLVPADADLLLFVCINKFETDEMVRWAHNDFPLSRQTTYYVL